MKFRAAGTAALLLGVGMGGFLDGIALHQICAMAQHAFGPDSPSHDGRDEDLVFLLFGGFLLIVVGWFRRSERSNS